MSASETGGVKPFSIGGRLVRERERLLGMTNEERAYRAQYLKDQILSPNEPVNVPEYWRERTNPIRRFYKFPLDKIQTLISPMVGPDRALAIRWWSGKVALFFVGAICVNYYFKYNANDWTRAGGWHIIHSKPRCVPGDSDYPRVPDRTKPSDYANQGFKNAPI